MNGSALWHVAWSLLAVLALIYALAWLARRLRGGATPAGTRVLARTALTTRASLIVVEAAGERLVLGVTAQSVRVLARHPLAVRRAPARPANEGTRLAARLADRR